MLCLVCGARCYQQVLVTELFISNTLIVKELCEVCQKSFINVKDYEGCQQCGQLCSEKKCQDCCNWQKIYGKELLIHESLFFYNEAMKDWFKHYKFLGDKRLAACFSKDIAMYFKDKGDRLIVPIPLDNPKFNKRGFNQVEQLLKLAGIEYVPLLKKNDVLKDQSAKSKKERLRTKQVFELDEITLKHYQKSVSAANIILVDDVYTTGRTLYHARDCLKKLKPLSIKSFSLAR